MTWQRLDARMVAVDATRLAGSLVPLAVAVALRNADAAAVSSTLTMLAAIAAAGALLDLWRWSTTSYRVTDTRVEVRTGVLNRRHVSMPRDRVRRVDATARLLHRAFGLAVVTIATGDQPERPDDEVRLDAVSTAQARDLRLVLLGAAAAPLAAERPGAPAGSRPGPPPGAPTGGDTPTTGGLRGEGGLPGEGGAVLASLRWRWAPYAVLSVWTLAVPALALGGLLQALSSVGVRPEVVAGDDRVAGAARALSPAAALALGLAVVLVVGAAGALARFVGTWWGFRLVREPGGRLRISRGLLTARSITLDEARLRGVELAEPALLRAAGGARLGALVTGVSEDGVRGEGASALLPAAPLARGQRVAAAVLHEDRSPIVPGDLRPHPLAARRRRLGRAAAATAATAGVVGAAGPAGAPAGAWALVPVVAAGAAAYALAAYRGLGHAAGDRYLVVRRGALVRRTVALRRTGVIGWTVRSTPFQRRLGLATVVATTAAGDGAYALADVDAGDGLRVATRTVPGLLDPFVARA